MDLNQVKRKKPRPPLYTREQRRRRDASVWTKVQGVLAIVQFGVFLVSLILVLRYLLTGNGWEAATISIICKTVALFTIMVTGSLWEYDVFGKYLLAPAFYWEDMVSFVVIALHTAYLIALLTGALGAREQMLLALAAYCTYAVNAAQFILKLRHARLESTEAGNAEADGRADSMAGALPGATAGGYAPSAAE